ncbi:hypothetical protein HAX54_042374, partial [Datura stramonium]|nr:hypothetical protein [Datura stramonium]
DLTRKILGHITLVHDADLIAEYLVCDADLLVEYLVCDMDLLVEYLVRDTELTWDLTLQNLARTILAAGRGLQWVVWLCDARLLIK